MKNVRRAPALFAVALAASLITACGGSSAPDTTLAVADDVPTETVATATQPLPPPAADVPNPEVYGTTPCAPVEGTPAPVRAFSSPFAQCIDEAKTYTATMVTNKGTMTFTLLDEKAPGAVNNFVNLARSKYFDGIHFHRVVGDFVLQGGDPTVLTPEAVVGGGAGGPGYNFGNENPQPGEYKFGDLAMANAGENTNGSQFFVISGPNGETLPPQYSRFGSMTEDPATKTTIDAIAALAVPGADGPPSEPVRIETVTIAES